MKRRPVLLLVVLALLLPLTACGGSSGPKLTVFAAASLKEAFTALGHRFEKEHPGTQVQFSFGASDALVQQIRSGAPAGVIATASTKTMDQINSRILQRKDFASNTMEIAVPAKNPAHITGLKDLTRPGVKVAVCQAAVPCGTVAAQVFANAHLKVTPATEEADVKSVLTKVGLDEVDAGIVYVSDVRTAGRQVKGIAIPSGVNATTTYPIAQVQGSKQSKLAGEFEQLVLSAAGRKALAERGFAGP